MNRNYLFLRLFGILAFCLTKIVAREAIIGGIIAEAKDGKYQVAVSTNGLHNTPPVCGGGILNDLFILSAAHCVITANGELASRHVSVTVGSKDLSIAGEVVNVTKIFIPTDYNPQIPHLSGDIAVFMLGRRLMGMPNYKKLLLPSIKEKYTFENKVARIAGFGWDKVSQNNPLIGEHSDLRLRYADVFVRTHFQCQYIDHPTLNFTKKHLCGRVNQYYNSRFGACTGDAGGPLVLKGSTVIGVLSLTAPGCSEGTSSGVYTRVSHYRDFVNIALDDIETIFMRVFHL